MAEFFQQAVSIRYNNPDKLEEELNRILGERNWNSITVLRLKLLAQL